MANKQLSPHPALTTKSLPARIVYRERDAILLEWAAKVRSQVSGAGSLREPIIINTIPLFIEHLAESLCDECPRITATENSDSAQEHGSERARVTRYGPEQLIQEYVLLRETIRSTIAREAPLDEATLVVIHQSFDKAIQESIIAYFLVHGRIREQFVATLTHDLRNPINAAKLAADLIYESADEAPTSELNEDFKNLSKRILKSLTRADRMIQDMLDASIVQVGETLTLNIVECDLNTIIERSVADRSKKETARLQVSSFSLKVFWDPDAFQRSLENLINNAFKYGSSDKPVTITAREIHGRVMVSVHNCGNPIPTEHQENLFQVFRRAEAAKAGTNKGWGIGLALARSTAEKLGGSLSLESSAERGTTFTIDVPGDARPFADGAVSTDEKR